MDTYSSYNRKSNNKGFTLVELIVVITIMAILTGTAFITFHVVRDADVSAASDKLVSVLASARKNTLAREADTVKMAIEFDSDDKYYARVYTYEGSSWVLFSEERLGGESLTFTIQSSSPGTPDIVMSGVNNKVEFNFKKANGSLVEQYKKIKIEGSDSKSIAIIRETGRCISE